MFLYRLPDSPRLPDNHQPAKGVQAFRGIRSLYDRSSTPLYLFEIRTSATNIQISSGLKWSGRKQHSPTLAFDKAVILEDAHHLSRIPLSTALDVCWKTMLH